MSKFDYLKGKATLTTDTTAEFEFSSIVVNGVSPTLTVKHAGEVNKPYFNDMLRQTKVVQQSAIRGGVNTQTLEQVRKVDRELFPNHVIAGWKNVFDENGEEVKFSKAECVNFVAALEDWMFEELTSFAKERGNFTTSINIEGITKNS